MGLAVPLHELQAHPAEDVVDQALGKGNVGVLGHAGGLEAHVDELRDVRLERHAIVHNVELKIGKGGAMARSAGNYAQIVGRDSGNVILRLNSGEQRLVNGQCFATVGAVSNPDHMNISLGKAGRNRWLGKRPHNRGVAMNPVDHPHGGGEGRTSGGRHPVTPWGKPTKGKKTRVNKRTDTFIVASRHARKKKG